MSGVKFQKYLHSYVYLLVIFLFSTCVIFIYHLTLFKLPHHPLQITITPSSNYHTILFKVPYFYFFLVNQDFVTNYFALRGKSPHRTVWYGDTLRNTTVSHCLYSLILKTVYKCYEIIFILCVMVTLCGILLYCDIRRCFVKRNWQVAF